MTNCSTSAVVAIPYNLGESTTLAAAQVADSYGWSFLFWPGSNLVSFTLVHHWAPGFKSTWDGIAVVLWNGFALAWTNHVPVAVGPTLADRVALNSGLKVTPSVDCQKGSATKITEGIMYVIYEIIKYTTEYTYFFTRWTSLTSKTESYEFSCWVKRKLWEIWCMICWIVRKIYMLICTLNSYVCFIIYRILVIPFKLFDSIKWYILLPFIPRLWDYDSCPCFAANFDASWTDPGVIYNGTMFKAP
jgi:hypothetical protein